MAKLVAVVDDDESVRSALVAALEAMGWRASGFDSAASFTSFARLDEVGCLITDLMMPDMNGLELQAKLIHDGYRIPTIFMTAHAAPELRAQAMAAGAIAFFGKPFDDRLLLETVRTILEN